MSKTTYFNLTLTAANETSMTFLEWRTLMNGTGSDSNMKLIDAALHSLDEKADGRADGFSYNTSTGVLQLTAGGTPIDGASVTIDLSDYYKKSETYAKTETYSKSETYSKEEVNNQIGIELEGYYDKTETYAKTETYSKSEVDNIVGDIVYAPISITALSVSPNQAEMGSTVTSATLTWTLSKTPYSMDIDGDAVSGTSTRTATLTGLSIIANKTWTLTATDAGSASNSPATATKTVSLTFLNRVYYGAAAVPANFNSAFLLGLSGKDLASGKAKTFTVSAGSGQYIWYAVPKRFGTCAFNVGGFDGGFSLIGTLQHTNASGYTEDYYVYRSDNAALGSTTVKVS